MTQVKDINSTTLKSVKLVFGSPWVYRDLKKCDHVIYFKDITKEPELARVPGDQFPLQTYFPRIFRRLCQVCEYHFAKFLVKKDKLSPFANNFYCLECFRDLHLE